MDSRKYGPHPDGAAGAAGLWDGHARMDPVEAARIADIHWGVNGDARRVDTEKDDTFVVTTADGKRKVLKISNPAENLAEIDFEVRLLRHVSAVDPGLPVPRVIPDRAGRMLVPLVDDAGQARDARLMSYLVGTPLDATGSSAAEREQVGRMLGRLRHATAGFTHAAQHRLLAWDVQHLPALRPLLEKIADPAQRDLLQSGLARFGRVVPILPHLRRQVLHNDFSKSNIIVDHAAAQFVQGIIDFGDAVHTAVAIDVSTALLNQLPRDVPDDAELDLFADGRDLLHGYLQVADLTAGELAVIPYLVMGRVIARALITLRRAAAMPENASYTLRNTEQGWGQLGWFLSQTDSALEAALIDPTLASRRSGGRLARPGHRPSNPSAASGPTRSPIGRES